MKTLQKGYLLPGGAIIFLAYIVWQVVTGYAYKTIWVDRGPIPEARSNPYYAAQKFLEKKGYDIKTSTLLSEVTSRLESNDTLLLLYDHEREYHTLSTEVHDWVKKGGHLVLTVHYLWDEDSKGSGDLFLDDLGVRQYLWPRENENTDTSTDDGTLSSSLDQETEALPEQEDTKNDVFSYPSQDSITGDFPEDSLPDDTEMLTCGTPYAESVSLLPLYRGSHPLHIAFESEYHVEDVSGNAHAPSTEAPTHLIQYAVGAGKITVLTDYFIFNDSNIGDYDHAFLLWALADTSPRVWMVYDKESDTLVQLIWESSPYLCISAMLLLAGWLIFRGLRFGPILGIEHASRRQLQEHIDASTSFIWRAGEQSVLIGEARHPVLNKCPIVQNQIVRTPRLLRALEQLDISEERMLWALTTPSVEDEAEFIELIRLLQQLRTTL